ncbi:hypothetical protein [Nocardia caishijiensis]|uniref:Uncharacterized protein n=1 Tax=Nocardia caishijiensis TaxID=184756 RepID=A0ABQ6YN35_9NOCA|nr:hypothetical protein [Nocardia caishijiensis]KAF0847194.1 hypothetical protein FNL39_10391 [Nocardia caishijiensis]
MTDIDEIEATTELVQATAQAAELAYPDWTYAVSTRVYPSRGVGTWGAVAYRGGEGTVVRLFGHREISRRIQNSSEKLYDAQGEECAGIKCSVARAGNFRIEYSYDIDEAIKWANQVYSGLTPEELVEILRPRDL